MFPNGSPLVKAVSNLGPLLAWMFSHPVIAGFFALIMSPFFGGVSMIFWLSVGGQLDNAELVSAFIFGGVLGIGVGAFVLFLIFAGAFFEPEEARYRLLFSLGGAFGITVFFGGLFVASRWEAINLAF